MHTDTQGRAASLLLSQPSDLLHACLMSLDIKQISALKPVCRALCRVARCLLNDVQWLGMHVPLHRLYNMWSYLVEMRKAVDVVCRNSGLTAAQFQERFFAWDVDDENQLAFAKLMQNARREMCVCARTWLSRAAIARVNAWPEEASRRSEPLRHECDAFALPLLPLHIALLLRLDDECCHALAAAHPPLPGWRLADLLRARQFGESASIARLESRPEEVNEIDGGDLPPLAPPTPTLLCESQPTFLHVASNGAPSAILMARLLDLHPQAAFIKSITDDAVPLHCASRFSRLLPCMPLEAYALLARANPAAAGVCIQQNGDELGTPLFAAALVDPERVLVLLEANPGAAAVAYGCDLQPSDSGYEFRGMLPLHAACCSGDETAIQALLTAYPQAARTPSTTDLLPHHCAAREGHLGALKLLVATHADGVCHQDDDGETPFDVAVRCAAKSELSPHPTHSQPQHQLPGWVHDGTLCPLPHDAMIAYLIASDMPITLDGHPTRSTHHIADFCWTRAVAWYDRSAAIALVLMDELSGGHGFYRRAKLLMLITRAALRPDQSVSNPIRYILEGALQAQPPSERALDERAWRRVKRTLVRS